MKMLRICTILVVATLVSACGATLSVNSLTNGAPAKGIVYTLPFTQFESKVTFFVENCGGQDANGVWQNFKIGTKVETETKTATDLDHVYDIDPSSYEGGLRSANITISVHEGSSTLKALNNTIKDQGIAFAVEVLDTAVSVYTGRQLIKFNGTAASNASVASTMAGGISGQNVPPQNLKCSDATQAAFDDVKTNKGELADIMDQITAKDAEIASKKAEIALIAPATDQQLSADLIQLTSQRAALATSSEAKTKELASNYAKISTSSTKIWPENGTKLISEKYQLSKESIYKWLHGVLLEISPTAATSLRTYGEKSDSTSKALFDRLASKLNLTPTEKINVGTIAKDGRPAAQREQAILDEINGPAGAEKRWDAAFIDTIGSEITNEIFDTYLAMVPADTRHATIAGYDETIKDVREQLHNSVRTPAISLEPSIKKTDLKKGIRYRNPAKATIVKIQPGVQPGVTINNAQTVNVSDVDTVDVAQMGVVNSINIRSVWADKTAQTLAFSAAGALESYGYVKSTSLATSVNKGLTTLKDGYLKDKELRAQANAEKTDQQALQAYFDQLELVNKIREQEATLTASGDISTADIDELIRQAREQALQ